MTHIYKVSDATKRQIFDTVPATATSLATERNHPEMRTFGFTDTLDSQLREASSTLPLDSIESEIYTTITHLEAERSKQSQAISTMRNEISEFRPMTCSKPSLHLMP